MTDGKPRLLCISQSFPPQRTPTGIRAGKLLARLSESWEVSLITETRDAAMPAGPLRGGEEVHVQVVPSRRPRRLLATLRGLRMSKLIDLLVWPDESIFWVLPAIRAARRTIARTRPEAVVVFMMPYSSGLVGVALRRLTGVALVLNLDDSPTCTDMHPEFPTRLHHRLATALEDLYARWADAVVYVSQTNLENVSSRQPEEVRRNFHLVRYGADAAEFQPREAEPDRFEVVYVGAMSGWWELVDERRRAGAAKRALDLWNGLGRFTLTELDTRTASPAVIGAALLEALQARPDWQGRVGMTVYENTYPPELAERALAAAGLDGVVSVHPAVAHEQVAEILARADLLFLTLPRRVDGTRGGRISAKTYEYLMTDRPILAALPAGENRDFLAGRPGVWLADPDGVEAMRDALLELVGEKLAGRPARFAREQVHEEIGYDARAAQFAGAIRAAVARGGARGRFRR